VALLVSGCAKEGADRGMDARDGIGFSVAVTRAAPATQAAIEGDAAGFRVWATGGDAPTGWYTDGANAIDGTNPCRHDGVGWGFADPVAWPAATGFPMRFHALYPAAPAGLDVTAESPDALTATYTVPPAAADQTDLLAATATAAEKPLLSSLPLAFGHITSMVDFGIVLGEGAEVSVQSVEMVGVAGTGSYDLIGGQWLSASGIASYRYFGGAAGTDSLACWPAGAVVADEQTPNPVYDADQAADKHLMLLPQMSKIWAPVSGRGPTPSSGAYVAVVYRMTIPSPAGDRRTGFDDASLHPDWDGSVTGPLFVRVGFPLPVESDASFLWEAGRSYRYNICLGTGDSSGGHILDEYYYDKCGNRTNLRLIRVRDEGKRVGDKMRDGYIHITLDKGDWAASTKDIFQSWPRFVPNQLRLPQAAQNPARQSIEVVFPETDDGDESRQWTLSSSMPWLLLSADPTGAEAASNLSGDGPATVYLVAMPNSTGVLRTAELYLNNERDDVVATVGQNLDVARIAGSGDSPVGFNTYVGAFWRHDQIGERVIRLNVGAVTSNFGPWSAEVAWLDSSWGADDGVMLAAGGSFGPTVGKPAMSAYDADAENFPVTGGSDFVGGVVDAAHPEIVFRIGLKSAYLPTAAHPARYGVVLIHYGDKRQKLFLRQGEHDDYLMAPSDPSTTGGITSRPAAVRFSPYNLTAPAYYTPVDPSGMVPTANPGRFTEFPTQGGVFFQWAATTQGRQRMAWPITGTVTNWDASYSTAYWNTLGPTHEACPPGYRRPTDGSIATTESAATISTSEMRQSLWWQPRGGLFGSDKTNNFWGYYADGYFDRRVVVDTPWATLSAVNPDSNEVGYTGCLFFNPIAESDHYNASLFFPAGGWRDAAGTLTGSGRGGHYWTSSAQSSLNAWILWIRNDWFAGMWDDQKSYALYVRCVRTTP
jgi:hypothetical protein